MRANHPCALSVTGRPASSTPLTVTRSARLNGKSRPGIDGPEPAVEPRNRQPSSALLVAGRAGVADLRADEQWTDSGGAATRAVVVVGVDDEGRLAGAALRGGQADAVAGDEGLGHGRDQ